MTNQTTPTGERIPAIIGRYQISGPIGFGAMGAVYKAFDPLIKRTLAIKTIRLDVPRQSQQHQSFIERFYQEARISGTLSHPNIVTLFDIGEEGGVPFLAMEFIDGRTIASYLEEGTRFKPEKVVALVSQVASALDYAHSRGVVHRDIKPSNLMLYDGDKVKVTDFGIAKLADAEITHAGALLGTPSYMSPEQAMGERLDGRSDIFSLGVCAFEMLSGQQPFPGANVTSILYKLVHTDPVQPLDLERNGLLPQKWHEVFARVLAKKPADRYQKASDFVRDLEYCLGSWFSGIAETTTVTPLPAEVELPATVLIEPPPETVLMSAAPRDGSADAQPEPTAVMPAYIEPEPTAVVPAHAEPEPALAGDGRPAESAPEPATVLLSAAASGSAEEAHVAADAATVMLAGSPGLEPPPPSEMEATVLLPDVAADELPATVLMPAVDVSAAAERFPMERHSPPEASQTLPPEPIPRRAVPTTAARHSVVRRGTRAPVVIGAAALLVFIVVAVFGYAWRRANGGAAGAIASPEPTAAAPATAPVVTTPAVAEASASLRVESEPSGARVLVNGEPRGQTPLDLGGLALGTYDLRVEQKGYDAQTQRVALTSDAPAGQVRVKLARTAPATGTEDIVSSPSGAAVSIDGKAVGRTPLNDVPLKPGSRTVRMELPGYEPWSGTVDVAVRKKGRVEARLVPVPTPEPKAVAPTPEPIDPARVYPDSDVDVKPRQVSGSSPGYPSGAPRLKSGQRVSVLVQFVVTETGEVRDVRVVESGGKVVDETVAAAVRGWRYQPATKRGTRVKSLTSYRVTYLGG